MAVAAGRRLLTLTVVVTTASVVAAVRPAAGQDTPAPKQRCTATNVGGSAYDGLVCGGSVIDNCTPGAIYQCQGGGIQDPVDNCVLVEVCASGCLTGRTSTPPTVNTDFPRAVDACFAGTRPLTLSATDVVGGAEVTVTATLSESQNTVNGPILNLRGGGTLIPHPFCAVPFRLAPGPTTAPASVTFNLPTAVVAAPAVVNLDAQISFTDTGGFGRTLVSIPWTVRLQAGGTEPPAPRVKTATVLPSIIGPGDLAVVDVELEKFAPARGIRATLASSHPDVLSVLDNGHPFVQGGCTTSAGAATVQAAAAVSADTTVTISARSGAPGETPATTSLLVRATPFVPATIAMSPDTVLAGGSSTGTVTMTRPAPLGGAEVVLTSSEPVVSVPASLVVPAGATSATFTATTRPDAAAFVSATIRAAYNGEFGPSAQLTVWPAGTAQAVTSLTLDPTIVVGPAPATGTVTLRYAPPSQSVAVTLASSNTGVVTVPPAVTVAPGSTRAAFGVSTREVTSSQASTISASFNGSVQSATLTVKSATPPPSSAVLSSFSVAQSTVAGGQSATGTVTLASAAPEGGVPVDLGSQLPGTASVPASVLVPAGATTASFPIITSNPSGTTTVSLNASLNGTTLFATLTVTQSAGGGGSASGFLSPSGNAPSGGGDGNGFQSNPANAHSDDTSSASDTDSGTNTNTSCASSAKDRHVFYNFGMSVPGGAAIAGIEVRLDARADSTSGSPRMCVQLSWDGGNNWTAAKATGTLGTGMGTFVLGGATDTWGRTWSAANLSNANFRLRIINVAGSTARDFFLDWVAVRPHFGTSSPASLSAVSVSPASVTGGSPATGTVTLTAAAPAGGFAVTLASDTPSATPPSSVSVTQGATIATFSIATSTVTATTTGTITASAGGAARTAQLTINPPSAAATLTVTATGRSGERVTSSPAGINVSVGSTGPASFASGTTITLSVSNGRDAIWSGACSSGGNKTRTCVFTLTGDGAVTANVQ